MTKFLTRDEQTALREILAFAAEHERQTGKGSYFVGGWAGFHLQRLLERARGVYENPNGERLSVLQEAWDAVDAMIVKGRIEGGGNGTDPNAQRNGMVLASNAIMNLISATRRLAEGRSPETVSGSTDA